MQIIGQCGPLVGTRLYPESQAPYYRRGMGICAGVMLIVAGLAVVLRWLLGRENRMALEKHEVMGRDERQRLVHDGKTSRRARAEPFQYML